MVNKEYINFSVSELFAFDEFDNFLDTNPIRKAELISQRLSQYLMIVNNVLYLFDYDTVTYKSVDQPIQDYLLTITRKLIVDSFEKLNDKNKRFIRKMYDEEIGGMQCTKLFKLDYYKDFILDIYYLLTNNSVVFESSTKYFTHFRNGYFDLKKNTFQKRDPEIHFVKDFNDEDYKQKKTPMDEDSDEESDDDEEEVIVIDKKEIKRIASLI
jgi:hypothetical protein